LSSPPPTAHLLRSASSLTTPKVIMEARAGRHQVKSLKSGPEVRSTKCGRPPESTLAGQAKVRRLRDPQIVSISTQAAMTAKPGHSIGTEGN
jgi:hypothetical protein